MNIFFCHLPFVTQTNNCYIYLHTIKLFNFLYKLLQTIAKAKQCKQKCIFFYIVIRMCMFVTNNSTDLKYTTNIENAFQVYVCRNHNAKLITRIVKFNWDVCHIESQSNFCFSFYSFINSTETWRLKPIFCWIYIKNCKLSVEPFFRVFVHALVQSTGGWVSDLCEWCYYFFLERINKYYYFLLINFIHRLNRGKNSSKIYSI